MKIAVTAIDRSGLTAEIDPHFGRASYFTIIEPDSMAVEMVENKAKDAAGGAGVSAAQTVVEQGVEVVIAGSFGPKAFDSLKAAGIKLYSCAKGTVKEVVEAYNNGMLSELSVPTNQDNAGRS